MRKCLLPSHQPHKQRPHRLEHSPEDRPEVARDHHSAEVVTQKRTHVDEQDDLELGAVADHLNRDGEDGNDISICQKLPDPPSGRSKPPSLRNYMHSHRPRVNDVLMDALPFRAPEVVGDGCHDQQGSNHTEEALVPL